MFRFKKEYANQTIVTARGVLINAANVQSNEAQEALKLLPSFAYMLESEEVEAPKASTPVKAEAPKPKKTRTRKS